MFFDRVVVGRSMLMLVSSLVKVTHLAVKYTSFLMFTSAIRLFTLSGVHTAVTAGFERRCPCCVAPIILTLAALYLLWRL